MKTNIPLLPLSIELRWRPLRPIRFSTRGILLAVILIAGFFGFMGELRRRAGALHYHSINMVIPDRGASPEIQAQASWHYSEYYRHQSACNVLEFLFLLYIIGIGLAGAGFVTGRAIAWVFKRSIDPV